MTNNFSMQVAYRTLDLLDERRARLYADRKAFYVVALGDRLMLIFDPAVVDGRKVNEDMAHGLSTRLQGRPVVRTNSRGLFFQVGYEKPTATRELATLPLDMSKQPTPFDMPVGETKRGALWVSLVKGDSFLVAGTRGFGKSGILQSWVQALLHGGQTLVYAYDGKGGTEFVRYVGTKNFHYISDLKTTLTKLFAVADERRRILIRSGFQNVQSYNAAHPADPLAPIALVIDEAAMASEEEREMLVRLVEKERFTGFHPVYGTNRPTAAVLLVKSNLATRICLPVPSWNDSMMVIGVKGAESLEKVTGRGLIVYQARVTEFQSYSVSWIEPTAEAKAFIDAQAENGQEPTEPRNEIAEMAERIRAEWSQGMSKNRVAQLLGWKQYGGGVMQTVNAVIEYLTSTSSSTTQNMPQNGVFGAVEA
jgi:hypothetical protein